ncbi:MAG TPA: MFS transporter, partial [Sphingobacteriaceae bacterium]
KARLSKAEFDYIHSDVDDLAAVSVSGDQTSASEKSVPWVKLLSFRQTWAFVAGKFLTDPVWWFYLFWLPAFLTAQYGLESTEIALPVALVYTMSTFGSIGGGYLPFYFIKKGWPVFRSQKTAMLIYAVCAIPVVAAQYAGSFNMWYAVIIIGFAASAHQAWSANIFTTVSDMFPNRAVASVTGIGEWQEALEEY